jgi:hypothetical protein
MGRVMSRLLLARPLTTLVVDMKTRASWLDDFVKWFFNASPVWVDERDVVREPFDADVPRDRRGHPDRRRHADTREAGPTDRRRSTP